VLQQEPEQVVEGLEADGRSAIEATEHPDIEAIDVSEGASGSE